MIYILFEAADRFGPFAFVIPARGSNPEWPGLSLRAVATYPDKSRAIAGFVDLHLRTEGRRRCKVRGMSPKEWNEPSG